MIISIYWVLTLCQSILRAVNSFSHSVPTITHFSDKKTDAQIINGLRTSQRQCCTHDLNPHLPECGVQAHTVFKVRHHATTRAHPTWGQFEAECGFSSISQKQSLHGGQWAVVLPVLFLNLQTLKGELFYPHLNKTTLSWHDWITGLRFHRW